MGPKKKAAGAAGEEEDKSSEQFYNLYKKVCKEMQIDRCKKIDTWYNEEYSVDELHLTKFNVHDTLGWPGIRAIFEPLKKVKYQHLKSIRLWKTECQDEGIRALVEYMKVNDNIEVVDLLCNGITSLGCEFISRVIHPDCSCNLLLLKLDHNQIGSAGVAELSKSLSQNSTLVELSLTYCNIDVEGARPLFEIVIYKGSALKKLHLSGNQLRDDGVILLLRGLMAAKTLEHINIADNQFYESE